MEITTRSLLNAATAVLLAVALPSRADGPAADPFVKKDAPPPAPAGPIGNLVFTVEIYTTSQADGAAILQGESSDQARYQRVGDLVKAGKASFDNVLAAACTSGGQAVVEGVDLMRYPISFRGLETKAPWVADRAVRSLGSRMVYKAQSTLNNESTDMVAFIEGSSLRSIVSQTMAGGGTLPRPQFNVQRLNLKMLLPNGKFLFLGTMTSGPEETAADSKMTLVFGKMEFVLMNPDAAVRPDAAIFENQFSLYSMDRDKAAEVLRQKEGLGSVFTAVQAMVVRNEAKLEHVSVMRGTGLKQASDEVYEFMYPTIFDTDQSVTQDVGFTDEAATKFIGKTSLVSVDITKLQMMRNRGQLQGQTVTNVYGNGDAPLFEIQSVVTSVNAPLGENEFVGTISPPGDVGLLGLKPTEQVWMAFVKTTVASP